VYEKKKGGRETSVWKVRSAGSRLTSEKGRGKIRRKSVDKRIRLCPMVISAKGWEEASERMGKGRKRSINRKSEKKIFQSFVLFSEGGGRGGSRLLERETRPAAAKLFRLLGRGG